jgi:hypothetical protein
MSSSSSSSSKMLRKPKRKPKSRAKSNVNSGFTMNAVVDSSSAKQATVVRRVIQMTNAPRANINVSTGATSYNNPTSSATFIASASGNVTSDACFAMFHTLSDLPQYTSWTAVFDSYRIVEIETTFIPNYQSDSTLVTTAQALTMPAQQLWYVVDLDDAQVVSPLTSIMEYENARCIDINSPRPVTVKYKPHVALSAYSGSFTSYANSLSSWIDCGSPTVQYYGLKFGIPCPIVVSFAVPSFSVVCKYVVEFRSVR